LKNRKERNITRYLLLSCGWELLGALVVSGKSVDSALYQIKTELGVLVLAVSLQMLSHSDSLLDQVIQILRNFGAKTWLVKLLESVPHTLSSPDSSKTDKEARGHRLLYRNP
jgi:hypothetical protein